MGLVMDKKRLSNSDVKIVCPKCHGYLGRSILIDNKPYFDTGGAMMLDGFKVCPSCGQKLHWHGSRLRWDDVLKKWG